MEEIPVVPIMLAVLGIAVGIAYTLTQLENYIDRNRNNLEKNLKEYEQTERKKQSQTGASK
tara:strand:+ start:649 stop:831 length:183 start_codon:yes stop_codon:yes gene_type:complete